MLISSYSKDDFDHPPSQIGGAAAIDPEAFVRANGFSNK